MAAIGTRKLTVFIDGDAVAPEVSSCVISAGDTSSDFVSFADAAAGGGREYTLKLTLVQDAATGSLWDRIWAHAGEEVPVSVRPYGNAITSVSQPHFTGTVVISEPDGDLLGGDADPSTTARMTVDVEWSFLAKPVRDTTP